MISYQSDLILWVAVVYCAGRGVYSRCYRVPENVKQVANRIVLVHGSEFAPCRHVGVVKVKNSIV
jgi:hypothetical protein